MRVVRFYDMMADHLENGEYITRQLASDLSLELSEDFDLDYAFDLLSAKLGEDVCSFRYEYMN